MADHGDDMREPVPPRETSPPVDPLSSVATPEGMANAPWQRSANLDPELERVYKQIESNLEPSSSAPREHVDPYRSLDSGIASVMFRAQRQWAMDGEGGGGGFAPTEAPATGQQPAPPTDPAPGTASPPATESTAFGAGAEPHQEPGWPAPFDPPTAIPDGIGTDAALSAMEALAPGSTGPAGWPGMGHDDGSRDWSFTTPGSHTDWFPPHGFSLGVDTMYTHIDTGLPVGGEGFTPTHTPGEIINPPLTPAVPMPASVDPPPVDLTSPPSYLGPEIISPTPDLNPPTDPAPTDPMPAAPTPSPSDGGGLAPENQAPFTC